MERESIFPFKIHHPTNNSTPLTIGLRAPTAVSAMHCSICARNSEAPLIEGCLEATFLFVSVCTVRVRSIGTRINFSLGGNPNWSKKKTVLCPCFDLLFSRSEKKKERRLSLALLPINLAQDPIRPARKEEECRSKRESPSCEAYQKYLNSSRMEQRKTSSESYSVSMVAKKRDALSFLAGSRLLS